MSTFDVPPSYRPFYDNWWGPRQSAARVLWAFHSALVRPSVPVPEDDASAVDTFFDGERARAEAGEPLHVVSESVCTEVYQECEAHGLDRTLLGAQVEAARLFVGPIRFATAARLNTFVRLWAVPHARLLAGLANIQSSVQRRHIDELARGFFLLGRLMTLARDARADRVFIPEEELKWAGVSVEQLREGTQTDAMQRLLWKQSVRIRDALAQGGALMSVLSFRRSYVLKYYWMGALALLNELERRDFDLWSTPLSLSAFRRVQVCLQVAFGRTAPG